MMIVIQISLLFWAAVIGSCTGLFIKTARLFSLGRNTMWALISLSVFSFIPLLQYTEILTSFILTPIIFIIFAILAGVFIKRSTIQKMIKSFEKHDHSFRMKKETFTLIFMSLFMIAVFLGTGYNIGGIEGAIYSFSFFVLFVFIFCLWIMIIALEKQGVRKNA